MSLFELLDKLVAIDIVGGKPVLRGHKAKGGIEMGLAYAGWDKEDDVFPVLQETHGGQFVDLALIDGRLEGKIEIVQGFVEKLKCKLITADGHKTGDIVKNISQLDPGKRFLSGKTLFFFEKLRSFLILPLRWNFSPLMPAIT